MVKSARESRVIVKWQVLLPVFLLFLLVLNSCTVGSKEPDGEQIKADLLGQRIDSDGFPGWRFEALSEFKDFSIKSKRKEGQIIEYEVSMRLEDLSSGRQYLADTVITYKKVENRWQFVSVVAKLLKGLY